MMRILTFSTLVVGVLFASPAVQAQTRPASAAPAQAPARPAVDEATRTFRAWDKNGDSQLSLAEFTEGFRRTRAVAEVAAGLRRQFTSIDANKNGAIDANEYTNLVLIKNAGNNAPPLSRFDANGNGKLEFNEYVKLVEALSPKPQAQQPAAGQGRR